MSDITLPALLADNPYPGRGILLGLCAGGDKAMLAYFIMGRSENSRNRVFTQTDFGLITQAADETRLKDPSLIIYAPLRRMPGTLVVTNGDQTDTVYSALVQGRSFEEALRTRTFEPDPPNLTPRISGALRYGPDGFCYKLSILKSAGNNAASAQRFFFEYPQPLAGEGHFISTYETDGNPLPSFRGEPRTVALPDESLDAFGQALWAALDAENKVSLLVKTVDAEGNEDTRIYNRYQKV